MPRMTRFQWNALQRRRGISANGSPSRRRLRVEALEDRRMLATVTVGNALDVVNAPDTSSIAALQNNDGGDGISLREAILATNNTTGVDEIDFGPLFDTPQTISFGSEQIISDSLTIVGDNRVTIDAGDGFDGEFATGDGHRIFTIDRLTGPAILVTLRGLTLSGGDVAGDGGAILNFDTLVLEESTISGNAATDDGGGIDNSGTANIESSTLSGNEAGTDGTGDGGALAMASGNNAFITNSTFSGNSSAEDGGGHRQRRRRARFTLEYPYRQHRRF